MLRRTYTIPFDRHAPELHVDEFAEAKNDRITVEADTRVGWSERFDYSKLS